MPTRTELQTDIRTINTAITAHLAALMQLKSELTAPTTTTSDLLRIRTAYETLTHHLADAEARRASLQRQLQQQNQIMAEPVGRQRTKQH